MQEKFAEKSIVLIENTGFTLKLIQKDPQDFNSEESLENRETFSVSQFSPATGVRLTINKHSQIKNLEINGDF